MGRIAIGSGRFRGMGLAIPKGEQTRPTSAKVRAAVFDMMAAQIPGAYFVDLFAGSGAMGCEALSRGATRACFVESNPKALKTLRANLAELARRASDCDEELGIDVIGREVERAWAAIPAPGDVTLWWADPPYAIVKSVAPQIANELNERAQKDSWFVTESDAKDVEAWNKTMAGHWESIKCKVYGSTAISVWQCQG